MGDTIRLIVEENPETAAPIQRRGFTFCGEDASRHYAASG